MTLNTRISFNMNDLSTRSPVSWLKSAKPVYQYACDAKKTVFEFDERYLYEKWQSHLSEGSKSYLLYDLSPKLVQWRHIQASVWHWLKLGGAFLLAALTLFFSEYNSKLPLLAPLLGLVGAVPFVYSLMHIKPRTWTYLYSDDGEVVTSMLIDATESVERRARREMFERQLAEAIESAKQQEYYN